MSATFLIVPFLILSTLALQPFASTAIPKNHTIFAYDSTCFHYSHGDPQAQVRDCLSAMENLLNSGPSPDARQDWSALPGNRPDGARWSVGTCEIGIVANWAPGHPHRGEVRDTFTLSQITYAAANTIRQCIVGSDYKVGGIVPIGRAVFDVYVKPVMEGQAPGWQVGLDETQKMR